MFYLDWASAAPPDRRIWEESASIAMEAFANPSSLHGGGLFARDKVEEARARTATALGVERDEVIFTSGATEANNLIMNSLHARPTKGAITVSGIEHPSVFNSCMALRRSGFTVEVVDPGRTGRLSPEMIARTIRSDTLLVSVMLVNNETGAIQPTADIVRAIRSSDRTRRNIHFHTDLVQGFGRTMFTLRSSDFDSAVISGHKIGAPRGAAVLILRRSVDSPLHGGDQERSLRPGTENLFAIWGTMMAIEAAASETKPSSPGGRSMFARVARETDGGVIVHGERSLEPTEYSPYICCLAFPPLPGEVLVRELSDKGVQIATGAACSASRRKAGDHRVLRSMGYADDVASSAIRISWAPSTPPEYLARANEVLAASVEALVTRVRV